MPSVGFRLETGWQLTQHLGCGRLVRATFWAIHRRLVNRILELSRG